MELEKLRKQIDGIDNKIIKLIAKRCKKIKKIGILKIKKNIDIMQKDRINYVINKNMELADKYEINSKLIKQIFNLIIRESIRIEKQIKYNNK